MKTSLVICVLMMSYLPLTDGGWFFRSILDKFCPIVCPKVCKIFDGPIGSVVCKLVCSLGCGRQKRHIAYSTPGHVIPLANRLDAFDIDDDGFVSKKEFGIAINDDESNDDFNKAFHIADKNGDGKLTPSELYKGPFLFELDLDGTNTLYCQNLLNSSHSTQR
ncbi:hypothetical protein SNE40_011059 [Patella caerulea]|uniref:EF-hand domain-containing protein n=1 Tax=Patella caerulea TaxID=87958 RepID=A0AAN8JRJ8_PATCE